VIEVVEPAEIEIAAEGARAKVSPERGGMVTTLALGGREIFFLDRDTFLDPTKNVRGGSPVLFPTPGKLRGDAWARGDRSGRLGQHGFARSMPWSIVAQDRASITLALEPTDATRKEYPWDFRFELEHRLGARGLSSVARIENRSREVMPFGLGYHPYFAIQDRRSFALESAATRAFDNVMKEIVPFDARALALGEREIDLHLLDHGGSSIAFSIDGARIAIEGAPELTHWVLWSLPGRGFVCVEPWTCPGDAMNSGDRLIGLTPGAIRELELGIRLG